MDKFTKGLKCKEMSVDLDHFSATKIPDIWQEYERQRNKDVEGRKDLYCNIIGDYTVFKNKMDFFALLKLITSWVNISRFTNRGPDYVDINFFLQNIVLPVSCAGR